MSRTDELRSLTTAWNDAWNSKRADELATFFTADGTYYEPDLPEALNGATGVAAAAERTWAEWPEATFEVVSLTIEEPRVVLEWRSSAKHKSGTAVSLEGIDVLEWQGDKLAAARVYYDVHQRQVALKRG